jgi:hypothetical protein
MGKNDDLAQGAFEIAEAYYGDRRYHRRIYTNPDGLPLFVIHGRLCAFKTILAAHKAAMAEKTRMIAEKMAKAAARSAMPVKPRQRRRQAREAEAAEKQTPAQNIA